MRCTTLCLLYMQEDEDRAPPADFVRASMSVPGFFQPLSIPYPDPEDPKSNKQCGAVLEGGSQSKIWQARNQYKGIVPQKAVFTDGASGCSQGQP
jgi:hypothetical protein